MFFITLIDFEIEAFIISFKLIMLMYQDQFTILFQFLLTLVRHISLGLIGLKSTSNYFKISELRAMYTFEVIRAKRMTNTSNYDEYYEAISKNKIHYIKEQMGSIQMPLMIFKRPLGLFKQCSNALFGVSKCWTFCFHIFVSKINFFESLQKQISL